MVLVVVSKLVLHLLLMVELYQVPKPRPIVNRNSQITLQFN